jgi:WD40 repeat protein
VAKPPELSASLVNGNLARAVLRPAWSPDGTQFVVADTAGNIVVFEERESRFVLRVTLHDPPRVNEPGEPQCYGVAWPTADVIVSLDHSADGFCANQRRASDLCVTAVAKSSDCYDLLSGGDGTWVVTAGGEAVTVLAVPGLETLASWQIGNRNYIEQGLWALATNGTFLAASTDGGEEEEHSFDKFVHHGDPRVDVIDVASKQTIGLIPYLARSLELDPWRQQLVHVGYPPSHGVKCFTYAGALVRELKIPSDGVVAAAVTKPWIITASTKDGTLLFWNAETLELVATVAVPDQSETTWIVPSPDGTRLLTKAANHAVRIWELDSAKTALAELKHLVAQPPSATTWAAICSVLGSVASSAVNAAVAIAREPLKRWPPELRTIDADAPWLRGVFDGTIDPRLELVSRATIKHEHKYNADGWHIRVDLMDVVELFGRHIDPAFDPPNVVIEDKDNIRGGVASKVRGNATQALAHRTRCTEPDMESWETWDARGLAEGRAVSMGRHDHSGGEYDFLATGDIPSVVSLATAWKTALSGASLDEVRAKLTSIRLPWNTGVRAALDAGDHAAVLSTLVDLEYLESRCRVSVAELLADLAYVLRRAPTTLPADAIFVHPSGARLGRGAVSILETLLLVHAERLPNRLFQVLHDELYWYDAPARADHHDGPLATDWALWRWAEHTRAIFEARPGAAWLRRLRPPRLADAALPAWQQAGEVRDVSPDGKRAFVEAGGDLYLIDVMTASARFKFAGANRGRFSPDGSHLLTSTGPTAALWASDAQTRLHILGPHPADIQRIMFSRDGQRVFTMCTRELRAWRVTDGSCATHATSDFIEDVLLCGDDAIVFYERGVGWQRWDGTATPTRVADDTAEYLVIAVSKAGDRFVQQNSSKPSLQGWSVADGTQLFETKTQFMMALAFHPDGARFIGTDGVLRDATTGTETSRLSTGQSRQPSFDPTGRFLLTSNGTYGNEAWVWNVATGTVIARIAITRVSHLHPIWSHDGRVVALPHLGVTAIADLSALSPSLPSRDDAHPVGSYPRPRFSPSGATLVVGHEDGIGFWDAERGVIRTFVDGVEDMGSFDTGRRVLGRRGVTLHAYGSEDAAELWRTELSRGDFESMRAADAGGVVLVAQSLPTQRIVALDINDGTRRYEIADERLILCDGDVLLTGATDAGVVKLRASATGEVSLEIQTTASTFALSPDHRWLAAVASKLEVWDLKTGTLSRTIESEARIVSFRDDSAAVIASDWQTQQSGNQDWNTEAIYDLATGGCISSRGWWDYDAEPSPPRELAPGIFLCDGHLRVHGTVVLLPIKPEVCRTERGEIVVASTHDQRVELFVLAHAR